MDNFITFKDVSTAHVPKGISGKKYLKTKDSTSKSGHSLVADIEMTHAGVVTRNLGFYLPQNMRDGAHTFLKDYKKPVLIGHDEDTDPIGRVIGSRYKDTSNDIRINDKYLSGMMDFFDKKSKKSGFDLTDFVQYVISNYMEKDSYRGLGHILGTLKITDEESIQKILDERYLTVSTSMTSDAARCSECGQDWISDGACEHERGQIYDSGVPMVLVPGKQSYNHVGIVSEPADVFAAGFKGVQIVKDGVSKELTGDKEFSDKFNIAANLFSYSNEKLISLSDEHDTNLIEVKNNIQEIEDSLKNMENVEMKGKQFADQIEATIQLWKYSEEEGSTSVSVRKYVKELSNEDLTGLAQKAMAALDSKEFKSEADFKDALTAFVETLIPEEEEATTTEDSTSEEDTITSKKIKVISDKFKLIDGETEYSDKDITSKIEEISAVKDHGLKKAEIKELANIIVRAPLKDALFFNHKTEDNAELSSLIEDFKAFNKNRFKLVDCTDEQILEKMNELLADDHKISAEAFSKIEAKDCAGGGKFFPVISRETYDAAKAVLGLAIMADSLKGKILCGIEKLGAGFADSSEEIDSTQENFDTENNECNNQLELSDDKLLEDLNNLLTLADERDLLTEVLSQHLAEKQQEIEILEQQLDLANDEVEKLEEELSTFKESAKRSLAEKVVDAKISLGILAVNNRESEIEKHFSRTEDSLKDMAKDFEGIGYREQMVLSKVENPVLQDSSTSAKEQVIKDSDLEDEKARNDKRKDALTEKYNLLKVSKGKKYADSWLERNS